MMAMLTVACVSLSLSAFLFFLLFAGECSNPSGECMFRHVSPEEKMRECPWYARGFCKHGTWFLLTMLQ
jgi:hypothetical protein